MALPQSDGELLSAARAATGAQNTGRLSQSDIQAELDAIKDQVTREAQAALDGGTIDLYDDDAVLELAQYILYLRVADKRRQNGETGENVPEQPIPRDLSRIQRMGFSNPTLGFWRDKAVNAFNRLTE